MRKIPVIWVPIAIGIVAAGLSTAAQEQVADQLVNTAWILPLKQLCPALSQENVTLTKYETHWPDSLAQHPMLRFNEEGKLQGQYNQQGPVNLSDDQIIFTSLDIAGGWVLQGDQLTITILNVNYAEGQAELPEVKWHYKITGLSEKILTLQTVRKYSMENEGTKK